MAKTFGKRVEFKKYLHGVSDAGARHLFKFRSGTHGLNEELEVGKVSQNVFFVVLCVGVWFVLWECTA